MKQLFQEINMNLSVGRVTIDHPDSEDRRVIIIDKFSMNLEYYKKQKHQARVIEAIPDPRFSASQPPVTDIITT